MNLDEWNDLGFNPVEDGYWPTPLQIKERMRERERQARKMRLGAVCAAIVVVAVFSILLYVLL